MVNNLLFSVVIPAYNCRDTISSSIHSVLDQTYTNWELLIIDDGSSDDTKEIVESFIQKEKRITYFSQSNKGVSAARNKGVEMSHGEFVSFLDGDDIVDRNWLMNFFELIQPDNDLVFCGAQFVNKEHSVRIKLPHDLGYLYHNMVGIFNAGAYAMRKDLFRHAGGFDPDIKFGENYDLGVRVAALKPTYAFNNQTNLIYHKELKRDRKSLINRIETKRLILDKYHKLNHFSEAQYREFRHQTLQSMAIDLIQLGEKKEGRRILFEILKRRPMSMKVFIRFMLSFTRFYGRT